MQFPQLANQQSERKALNPYSSGNYPGNPNVEIIEKKKQVKYEELPSSNKSINYQFANPQVQSLYGQIISLSNLNTKLNEQLNS